MKRGMLLNRHVSALVAELGHLDELVVADAGLPSPPGVNVIDLAVSPGIPRLREVLAALSSELIVEKAITAREAGNEVISGIAGILQNWQVAQGAVIEHSVVDHDAFKARTATAKAIIRTGEIKPYANVILSSGVVF